MSQAITQDLSWRARVRSLRNLSPLLGMVWDASPALMTSTICLRLCRAVVPLVLLWIPKLILDAMVNFAWYRSGNIGRIWKLVLLEFAVAVMSDTLARVNTLSASLLADRFTNTVSI